MRSYMRNDIKVPLIIFAVVIAVFILWFGVHSARKVEVKRYAMTGTVLAVHAENGTASVHNDDIPGFMRPMEMDYKVPDRTLLTRLKPGDRIRATLASDQQNVWELQDISVIPSARNR